MSIKIKAAVDGIDALAVAADPFIGAEATVKKDVPQDIDI